MLMVFTMRLTCICFTFNVKRFAEKSDSKTCNIMTSLQRWCGTPDDLQRGLCIFVEPGSKDSSHSMCYSVYISITRHTLVTSHMFVEVFVTLPLCLQKLCRCLLERLKHGTVSTHIHTHTHSEYSLIISSLTCSTLQCPEDAEEDQHHVSDHLVFLLCFLLSRALLRLFLLIFRLTRSETLQPGAATLCQPSEGNHI